jgi:hypothetical protein
MWFTSLAGCGLAPSFFWILRILGSFCAVVGVIAMVHAVRWLECVSAVTSALT